jgi:hypothetical protein
MPPLTLICEHIALIRAIWPTGVLPSEGKGQKFESSRARHDFNNLAGIAKEPLYATEASRKHAEGNIWTDCRAFVGELVGSGGRHRDPSR